MTVDLFCVPGGRLAGTSSGPNLGQSVFDYIDKQNARYPMFYNFLYTPDLENTVSNFCHYNCIKFFK